jgi:tetratricopeptide (TPR) repeat protein
MRSLAEAAWHAREWEEIADAYDALLAVASPEEQPVCGLRLGMALERQGRRQAALPCYRAGIDSPCARGPVVAELWENLAALCVRIGDPRGAAAAYAGAAVDPRTEQEPAARAQHHLRAAEVLHRRLGDPDAARGELEASLALLPDHLPALDALEWIHAEAGRLPEVAAILARKIAAATARPQLRSLYGRLLELEAGPLARPDAARATAERLLEIDPRSRPALTLLAADARERGDLARAEALYHQLVDLLADQPPDQPERLTALAALGAIRFQIGHHADAEGPLREAVQLAGADADPALRAMLEELAAADRRWADLAELLAQRAAATADPEQRRRVELRRIQLLLDPLDDPRAAGEAAEAALARWPDDLELRDLVAAAEAARRRAEVDREAIRERIRRLTAEQAQLPGAEVARHTRLRHQLAELHLQLGEAAAARRCLELVLAEEPTRISALELLVDLDTREGRWREVAEGMDRLARLVGSRERRAELLFEMGEILRVRLGREDEAGDAYLRASDLSPRHAPTLRRVADTYWKSGDHAGVAEVARELDGADQLLVSATEPRTLARVAVAAALGGDLPLARRAAAALAERNLGALIAVVGDIDPEQTPLAALTAALAALCAPPGPPREAIRAALEEHASATAQAVARGLRTAAP